MQFGLPAFPTGTILGTTDTQTLTNKTLGAGSAIDLGADAAGDLYFRNGSGDLTRLGLGTVGQVLMSNGTNSAPEWTDKVAMDTQNVAGAINAALNISGPNVTTVVVNDSVGGGDYSTISGATPGQVLRLWCRC